MSFQGLSLQFVLGDGDLSFLGCWRQSSSVVLRCKLYVGSVGFAHWTASQALSRPQYPGLLSNDSNSNNRNSNRNNTDIVVIIVVIVRIVIVIIEDLV